MSQYGDNQLSDENTIVALTAEWYGNGLLDEIIEGMGEQELREAYATMTNYALHTTLVFAGSQDIPPEEYIGELRDWILMGGE